MGNDLPKQFIPLKDKPVLYYSLRAFAEAYPDIQIILVLPANHIDTGKNIVKTYFAKKKIQVTEGGETRFQSVKNGLALVREESIIFVHDGVRCLLTSDLIHRCYEMALETGSAIPVIPIHDSVRLLKEERSEPVDRNKIVLVQTPQTFHSKILLPAFRIDYKEKFTDEATVVEAFGMKVSLLDGEVTNIKITRPVDLMIAEKILEGGAGMGN
jgi:2-C-methyl-D-erythritol 4-phosphate cytidylyltransferase